jgi:hypothetical protein
MRRELFLRSGRKLLVISVEKNKYFGLRCGDVGATYAERDVAT